ncbi:MAG: alpha/beta fold hydrolase [Bacteroidia bacterium]
MRPQWLNPAAYPFKAYWFPAASKRLHYLDEGKGPAIVMLHGLGTWSYLFRNQIKELMADHRCLVPDLPGHGFSDSSQKPLNWDKELDMLSDWIETKLPERFILIGHDTGGLFAQHLAARFAERLDALVLVNSWAWPITEQKNIRRQSFWYRNALGRWWQARSNSLLKGAFRDKALREAKPDYLAHFSDRASRVAIAERFAATRSSADFFATPKLTHHIPTLILEGGQDRFRSKDSSVRWGEKIPYARYQSLAHAGHYLPEESDPFFLQQLRTFLKSIHTPSSNSHA